MQARVHLCIYQHTNFEVLNFTDSKDMVGAKLKKHWSRDHDDAHYRPKYTLSSHGQHLIYSTCVQNLATLASAVPEMSLGPQNLKWVTWP